MRKYAIFAALVIVSILFFSLSSGSGLTREESDKHIVELVYERRVESLELYGEEWKSLQLKNGEYTMSFDYKLNGSIPEDGRAMYISMHGGGGTTAEKNDQQWENQKSLYEPHEGVYFVPRAPTNTWNMWHQEYMDGFIEKIIEMAIIMEDVNPNKVYIMGYSAGGDGTYQLAPRLADKWAAAAMSAGHPGDARIENLRNLPFALYMGAKDSPYNRNHIALEWSNKLDSLATVDVGGYTHSVQIFEQHGHWMEHDDAVSMDWMPQFYRNPIPERVVWYQDNVLRKSFYWLQTYGDDARQGDEIIARYEGQNIYIESSNVDKFVISLNDSMMDLDSKVTIYRDGSQIYNGKVNRYLSNIKIDVDLMLDEYLVFPVKLVVEGNKVYEL